MSLEHGAEFQDNSRLSTVGVLASSQPYPVKLMHAGLEDIDSGSFLIDPTVHHTHPQSVINFSALRCRKLGELF